MNFLTETHPGVCAQPSAASNGFVLNHCMLRVKDPAVALDFYTRVFGMRVLRKLDFPEMKFSLYFLHREVEGNPASFSVPQLWVSSRMPCCAKVHAVRSPMSSGAGLSATSRCRK